MTVRQLLENIDSIELTEWLAYDQIEPLVPSGRICGLGSSAALWPITA